MRLDKTVPENEERVVASLKSGLKKVSINCIEKGNASFVVIYLLLLLDIVDAEKTHAEIVAVSYQLFSLFFIVVSRVPQ